jgi:hypothetical protein
MGRLRRRLLRAGAGGALLLVLAFGVGLAMLDARGVTPRALARHVAVRAAGHGPATERLGRWIETTLQELDRGASVVLAQPPAGVGAGAADSARAEPPLGHEVRVATSDQVRAAIAAARPGDVITLAAGTYRFSGESIGLRQAGSARAGIVLRGAAGAPVLLEFDLSEGFLVAAPFWTVQALSIRGVCRDDSSCEHAFHVVGGAHHFTARDNTVSDFNAHFKVNGSGGVFPDFGTIDGNTIGNHRARHTGNPVSPIDLVAASHWRIRRNLISDFVKAGGDGISYGAFAKGGGSHNLFEHNVIWCERALKGAPGQRVGLSLGDGGTGAAYCRDRRCVTEQDLSVIQGNLILACSDDGIYLNSAARSTILHNTLIDTGGVVVRYPTSSAEIEGNLVDGAIRSRNGGIVRLKDNDDTSIAARYLGRRHGPDAPGRRAGPAPAPPDLCGVARPATPSYGAYEDLSACR